VTSFTAAARRVARQTGLSVREARAVGAQHGYQHLMLTLAGGQRAFAKVAPAEEAPAQEAPAEIGAAFAAEANSLRWLAEADAVPVPEVLAVTGSALVISMIPPGHATASAAFQFGAELARLHAAGPPPSVLRGGGSSPACPWTTLRPAPGRRAPRRDGRSGTPAAGCSPTSGWQWTPARSGPRTDGWWRR
jgi:hypothetical protein